MQFKLARGVCLDNAIPGWCHPSGVHTRWQSSSPREVSEPKLCRGCRTSASSSGRIHLLWVLINPQHSPASSDSIEHLISALKCHRLRILQHRAVTSSHFTDGQTDTPRHLSSSRVPTFKLFQIFTEMSWNIRVQIMHKGSSKALEQQNQLLSFYNRLSDPSPDLIGIFNALLLALCSSPAR